MTNVLTINGKEYIQSNRLAREFGYTTDYIGRLAREEKILATQVGRQWFVEPESLRVFSHQAQLEKEIRKEELRQQRKLEQVAFAKREIPALERSSSLVALAQLFLIISCGFFVGGLASVATSEGLTVDDFKQGGMAIALLASEAFDPSPRHALYTQSIADEDMVASIESVIDEEPAPLRFTELPEFPQRLPLDTATESALHAQFSDEVEITVDEEGVPVVRPIFRDGTQEGTRFLLVPINESTN